MKFKPGEKYGGELVLYHAEAGTTQAESLFCWTAYSTEQYPQQVLGRVVSAPPNLFRANTPGWQENDYWSKRTGKMRNDLWFLIPQQAYDVLFGPTENELGEVAL